jgi:hypothetical protein
MSRSFGGWMIVDQLGEADGWPWMMLGQAVCPDSRLSGSYKGV